VALRLYGTGVEFFDPCAPDRIDAFTGLSKSAFERKLMTASRT